LFTVEGGGGTHPIHSFGVSSLKSQLLVNRHYRLFLLPGADEPLCMPNMWGTLAYALEHEASEQTPTIHLLFRQKTTGAHATDLAMVAGFVTISGASRGRLHGAIDPTNKFNLIARTAGTWLTVHPRVVPLPLKPMGKVFMRNGNRYEDHYEVSLPDELGGKRVTPILQELYNLVAEDPAAPHFITVASSLHPDEIEYIASGVKRFPLQAGGRIHVFYNPCWPVVSPVTDMTEGLICDFRGGKSVGEYLSSFLGDKQSTDFSTGFAQADRHALATQVAERSLTEEIEEELLRILKGSNL
jgi:hypothetical protein